MKKADLVVWVNDPLTLASMDIADFGGTLVRDQDDYRVTFPSGETVLYLQAIYG